MKKEPIKAEYNGYTGYAYGVGSFSIEDKDGHEIFHTGFLNSKVKNEAECLQKLKEILALLESLHDMRRDKNG